MMRHHDKPDRPRTLTNDEIVALRQSAQDIMGWARCIQDIADGRFAPPPPPVPAYDDKV